MEDLDDEVIQPDQNGAMLLSHRGWNDIPHQIFSNASYKIIDLDVSYNSIANLSDSISCCIKLRRLNVSNNELTILPDSLAKCQQLEILLCSNNKILSLPRSFGSLLCLEEVDLRNNRLEDLPDILSNIPLIKSVLYSGNHFYQDIPLEIVTSGQLFLWYLRLRDSNRTELMRSMDNYNQLETLCQNNEFSLLQLEDSMNQINIEVERLVYDRPIRYLELKGNLCSTVQGYLDVFRPFVIAFQLAIHRWMK